MSLFRIPAAWVLPLALAALLLPIGWMAHNVLTATHGVWAYALDDAFIHMAIAKNLAFHGVWGTSPHEFASAASSLLYPVLLAAVFKVAGSNLLAPFFINLTAGIFLLIAAKKWLVKQNLPPAAQLGILLALIFLIPLPVLIFIGMEHTLQILFCFLFIYSFADDEGSLSWKTYLYGALMVACRYECATLLVVACGILLSQKKVFPAMQLGLIGMLPVLLFGIYSLYQGSYFVPNSVLLKSKAPAVTYDGLYAFFRNDLWERLFFTGDDYKGYNILAPQRLILILPLIWLVFRKSLETEKKYKIILLILVIATGSHLSLAIIAKSPRFEAYLIGNSIIIISILLVKYGIMVWRSLGQHLRWLAALLCLLLAFPYVLRAWQAFDEAEQACVNIYEQQYQMGRFFHKYYNDTPVALHDIGAVSYLTDASNLDLIGLANIEVARSRKLGYWGYQFLDSACRRQRVKVAAIYEDWMPYQLTARWKKIGIWTIQNNVICGNSTVTFYAVDSTEQEILKSNLMAFKQMLPPTVSVYFYPH
jgi:hypothetical protein